eukprot:4869478-Pyramimonas_sp.AAC.1
MLLLRVPVDHRCAAGGHNGPRGRPSGCMPAKSAKSMFRAQPATCARRPPVTRRGFQPTALRTLALAAPAERRAWPAARLGAGSNGT